MSSYPSLRKNVRSCQVAVDQAIREQGDRELRNQVCPVWSGVDNLGRNVCASSFVTVKGGCNSASDRITVENSQRPRYAELIGLSVAGISEPGMAGMAGPAGSALAPSRQQFVRSRPMVNGNFGVSMGRHLAGVPKCNAST